MYTGGHGVSSEGLGSKEVAERVTESEGEEVDGGSGLGKRGRDQL